jgi:hypothetical protein
VSGWVLMVRWIFFYTHTCVQKLDGKSAKYEIPMVYFFDLTCAVSGLLECS